MEIVHRSYSTVQWIVRNIQWTVTCKFLQFINRLCFSFLSSDKSQLWKLFTCRYGEIIWVTWSEKLPSFVQEIDWSNAANRFLLCIVQYVFRIWRRYELLFSSILFEWKSSVVFRWAMSWTYWFGFIRINSLSKKSFISSILFLFEIFQISSNFLISLTSYLVFFIWSSEFRTCSSNGPCFVSTWKWSYIPIWSIVFVKSINV
jgi:hypothetical protein